MDQNNLVVKLAVVYLGKNFGKAKFSLVDEKDISIAMKYKFDLQIDTRGNGSDEVRCYAITRPPEFIEQGGCYLHEMVWIKHKGAIPNGFQVYHKNGLTLDNRLSNLHPLPSCPTNETQLPPRSKMPSSLYWQAMMRLPPMSTGCEDPCGLTTTSISPSGEKEEQVSVPLLYECQNTPCLSIERYINEFSSCPKCQTVRYCSSQCLQMHLVHHSTVCSGLQSTRSWSATTDPPQR